VIYLPKSRRFTSSIFLLTSFQNDGVRGGVTILN
jgi:hypothetical protein